MQNRRIDWLVISVAAFGCMAAWAQTTAPGRIEQDVRPLPEPAPREAIRIPRPSFAEQAPPGAENITFTLGAVELSGNAVMPLTDLEPLWASQLGQTVTLAQAFGIAAAISARYRQAGYILSQAIVPVQDIPTGSSATLRINVLEGYVEQVRFSGLSADLLKQYLEPVTAERPLRLQTLERALLLVNELAGVNAQANIRAGTAPGSSQLEIVAQQDRRAFSVLAHNRSTPSLGRIRWEAGMDFRGVAGNFDRHMLRLITSADERLNLLAYSGEAPVGTSGLKAQWFASKSRAKPESPLPNIDTESDNVSLGLSYPVWRSRQSNLSLRATLAGYNNSAGQPVVSRDRIRALRLGLAADHADNAGGISLLDAEISKGLSTLGASQTDDPLLFGAKPNFTKATLYAARLQSLGGDWSVLAVATAQVSPDKLPTAEQLGLGGDVFLRAFDPSEVIGERGYAAKLELRYNKVFGSTATTFYVFGDAGRVTRKQIDADTIGVSLASYGAGVRMGASRGLRGYVELAKPLKRDVASQGDRDVRLFAGIGFEF